MKNKYLIIITVLLFTIDMIFMCDKVNGVINASYSAPELSRYGDQSSDDDSDREIFFMHISDPDSASQKLSDLVSFDSIFKVLNYYSENILKKWDKDEIQGYFNFSTDADIDERNFLWYPHLSPKDEKDFKKTLDIVENFILKEVKSCNEMLNPSVCPYTAFNCTGTPDVNLITYTKMLSKLNTTSGVNIASIIYIDNLLRLNQNKGLYLASSNVYKLLSISRIIANEIYDDIFYPDSYISAVVTMPKDEVRQLKMKFCLDSEFDFIIDEFLYKEYFERLFVIMNLCKIYSITSPYYLDLLLMNNKIYPYAWS